MAGPGKQSDTADWVMWATGHGSSGMLKRLLTESVVALETEDVQVEN